MKYCDEGNAPLPFQDIIALKFLADKQENIFGNHDEKVKDILKTSKWFITGVGELGRRPHCRILSNGNKCYFHDTKNGKCMLGDYRPTRCD